jgi:predicted double-glycine peptidase
MKQFAAWLVCAALLTGAGARADGLELVGVGGARYALKVTSLKEARFKTTTRQQYDFSCGSAAVATLLTYQYGKPVSEQSVFDEMYAKGDQARIQREGFSLLDLKNYLKAHAYEADGFAFALDKLLDSSLPAIVLISDGGYNHFVVVKGLRDGRVLMGDPSSGTRAVSRARFEAMWINRLLFVVHNRQEEAQFNTARDWQAVPKAPLTAAFNFENFRNTSLAKLGPGDF